MTLQLIEETSGTTDKNARAQDSASTAPAVSQQELRAPERFLAAIVLTTALFAGSNVFIRTESAATRPRRRNEECDTATEPEDVDEKLVDEARVIFERGGTEFFQDGMHTAFSHGLLAFLALHGRSAFQAIAEYLAGEDPNPDVVSEALRWLGDFGDEATLRERWSLLQQMLRHRSPRVRDGAILGFAAMDHPRSKPVLVRARDVEHIAELQQLLQQVIEQLDATNNAPPVDRRSPE